MPQETEAILPQRTTAPAPKPYEFESDGLMRVTKSRMKVVARSREGMIAHSCLGEVSESMAPTIIKMWSRIRRLGLRKLHATVDTQAAVMLSNTAV